MGGVEDGRRADDANPGDWSWLDVLVGEFDRDFVEAAGEQPPEQQRPGLETLFS
jgi:hypothetical protein